MSSNLRINTSVENGRLQALLAKQAEFAATQAQLAQLEAEIASLQPSNTSSPSFHNRTPIHKQHSRRNNVSRSLSSSGVTSMSRQHSSDRIEASVQQRRTLSQRSATSMSRKNSRGTSSQQGGNVPFTQNGAIPPVLNTESSRRENPAMMAWAQNPPLSSYTFSHQPAQLQRKPELDQVPELDHLVGGEDPGQFIYRTMGLTTPTVSISPSMSDPSSTNLSNPLSSSSYSLPLPSTPTSDSLTTATTLTSSMSRQNSLCTVPEPLLESIQMMNVNSSASYSSNVHDEQAMYDQVVHYTSSHHNRRSSNEEQSQLLVGAGGASHESQFSHSLQMASSPSYGEKMEKSPSNESTSSLSSTSSSRNVKRLQDQITLAAARPLKPKGGFEDSAMSRETSSQSMSRLESREGSQDKVAISKPSYQRPKHDRVFCKQCENHQEGFRGEHELRRHQDREHKPMVKKWVCIEPTDGSNHPKPVLALSRCKACAQQKKKYGAYYNAAAHLRRAHFKPKSKGRAKSNKNDSDEKRGGKGGGDWPPMSELKMWMKEVEEQASEFPLSDAQQEAADASDEEIFDDEPTIYSQPMTSMGNFDYTSIADNSPIIDIYPNTVHINNDMFGMQMPLDLSGSGQTQCMDQSMYTGPTQNLFPSFSTDSFQNDHMVFFNNPSVFPQHYDDQVTGWS